MITSVASYIIDYTINLSPVLTALGECVPFNVDFIFRWVNGWLASMGYKKKS